MYSEQFNEFLDIILEDGSVTDQERNFIHKKAIAEGIDQTRGWFYSLLVISVFVKGCSPYKNVLVNEK